MKKAKYISTIIFGLFLSLQLTFAQIDFNKRPDDDLGNVEDEFQEYFFEALKQRGIENYGKAVDALLKCLNLKSSEPTIYFELGKNYNELKNFGAAEDALKKALEIQPDNEWYLDELYHVYVQQDDMSKAIKTVKQLVKYHPDYKQDLASLYVKEKKYKQALEILDELDKEFGINESRDLIRNEIYNLTGNDKDRIDNLEERVASNPDNELDQLKLIYRYSQSGATKKAFKAAEELLEAKPESKLVHLALYKFYLDDNKIDKALNSMKIVFEAQSINPDSKAKVLKDFVTFVNDNPEYEKELLAITLLAESSKDPKTLADIGDYYSKTGDKQKALTNYEEALKEDPNSFILLKKALLTQLDLNLDKEALNRSKKALQLYPAQSILYLINGVANNKLNKPKAAITSLEMGLDFIVDDPKMESDFYIQLSKAYKLTNNNTKAETFAKKAENLIKAQQ